MENQTGVRVKKIRSDRGGEFLAGSVQEFFKEKGIIHEKTASYQPQQNGVAERINRTLCEKARSMLYFHNVERQYWAEALRTALEVRNALPTKILEAVSPYEKWYGRKPDVAHLRVFGCKAYVMNPSDLRKKWDPKSRVCTIVGYEVRNYRFVDDRTKKLVISANGKFMELPSSPEVGLDYNKTYREDRHTIIEPRESEDTRETHLEQSTRRNETGTVPGESLDRPVRRSERRRELPLRLTYEHATEDENIEQGATTMLANEMGPRTVKEAISGEQKEEWKTAMESEMKAHIENRTWKLVPPEPHRSVLSSKWIFKIKPETENQPRVHKARLVCRGFEQRHGIDYFDIYAPVIRMTSLRILLSIAIQNGMHLSQMDVKTAFLNGSIEESVYMTQPEEFIDSKHPNYVCKLEKSIYGLIQAP